MYRRAWQSRGAELGRGEERTDLGASLVLLGRGEERSLAEARSGAWQRRGVKLGRGEGQTRALGSWMAWSGGARQDEHL